MHRFFVDPAEIDEKRAVLTGDEATHARNVLRLEAGDAITLFDGQGFIYDARIEKLTKTDVVAKIINRRKAADGGPELHLGIGLLKGAKMELVIQKATELGVHTLHPFISEHAVAQKASENKIGRWHKIGLEACKQCNRPVPLTISPINTYAGMVELAKGFDTKLLFWENDQENRLNKASIGENPRKILALIGPEGGFSTHEVDVAHKAGFKCLSLGTRILRAETAAISVMAILQFLAGNLNPDHALGKP